MAQQHLPGSKSLLVVCGAFFVTLMLSSRPAATTPPFESNTETIEMSEKDGGSAGTDAPQAEPDGARDPSMSWWTVDSGGGDASGGVYEVSATIGQPDIQLEMSGGSYSLSGGFWPGVDHYQSCDADRSGRCDARDLSWFVGCAADAGCACPGNPDANGDGMIDGHDIDLAVPAVF